MIRPTVTMESQFSVVTEIDGHLDAVKFSGRRRERAHGHCRPALPANHASQIAGRHRQLDDLRAAAIELRHTHVGRTAGQGLRHDLDHVACAAHDAAASVAAGAATGARSISVRTLSDG